jgi:single-strand DNA-binding protein
MSTSINKAIILGNLGKDPEIRSSPYGKRIAIISVATKESWIDKESGDNKELIEWHKVVIHNQNLVLLAEKYLKKGTKVYLEGKIQTRKFLDKNGVERFTTEIILQAYGSEMVFVSNTNQSSHVGGESYSTSQSYEEADVEEVPF